MSFYPPQDIKLEISNRLTIHLDVLPNAPDITTFTISNLAKRIYPRNGSDKPHVQDIHVEAPPHVYRPDSFDVSAQSNAYIRYEAKLGDFNITFTFNINLTWVLDLLPGAQCDIQIDCVALSGIHKMFKRHVEVRPTFLEHGGEPYNVYAEVSFLEHPEFAVQFQSLVLPKPLFPVIDETGRCCSYRTRNQLLADRTGGLGAGTFALSASTSMELELKVKVDPEVAKLDVILAAEWQGVSRSDLTSTRSIHIDQNGELVAKVCFLPKAVSNVTPWGYYGTVKWVLHIMNTRKTLDLGQHNVEFYAVSTAAYPFLDIEGIPLSLLRFAVLPTRVDSKIINNYPAWIVQRIHEESGFAYERVGGFSMFITGSTFDLTAWLVRLKANTKDAPWHINCYDLAAITGICMGFFFENDRASRSLQWHIMDPFGYIMPTHLIGWDGITNSPIIGKGEDPSQNRNLPYDDPKRNGFGRHVFLTWHGKVLDATAGPHLGTEYLREYIAKVIDMHGLRERKDAGTISDVQLLPSTFANHGGNISEREVVLRPDSGWTAQEISLLDNIVKDITPAETKKESNISLGGLLDEISFACRPDYKITGTLLPLSALPSKPEIGTKAVWRMNIKHLNFDGIVNLSITVFDKLEYTQRACMYLLSAMSVHANHDDVKTTEKGDKYHVIDNKTSCHLVWIAGAHMLVSLNSYSFGAEDTMPVVKRLMSFLSHETENTSPYYKEPMELTCNEIAMHYNEKQTANYVLCGTTIKVMVDVQNWAEFDWKESCGNAIVTDYVPPEKGDLRWTFDILARSPGMEVITFTFTDSAHYYMTRTFTLHIVEDP